MTHTLIIYTILCCLSLCTLGILKNTWDHLDYTTWDTFTNDYTWGIANNTCVKQRGGIYTTFDECDRNNKYTFVKGILVRQTGGEYNGSDYNCTTNAYAYVNGICVKQKGAPYGIQDECTYDNKWIIANATCVKQPGGTYSTLDECDKYNNRWIIANDTCVKQAGGTYSTLDECVNNNKFAIVNGVCVRQAGGQFNVLSDCIRNNKYALNNGACIQQLDGPYSTEIECSSRNPCVSRDPTDAELKLSSSCTIVCDAHAGATQTCNAPKVIINRGSGCLNIPIITKTFNILCPQRVRVVILDNKSTVINPNYQLEYNLGIHNLIKFKTAAAWVNIIPHGGIKYRITFWRSPVMTGGHCVLMDTQVYNGDLKLLRGDGKHEENLTNVAWSATLQVGAQHM
jgi:hypothetical protein